MLVTNLKAKKVKPFFQIQELASWSRAAATMEGAAQTRASVLGIEKRRKERMALAFCTAILSPLVLGSNRQ